MPTNVKQACKWLFPLIRLYKTDNYSLFKFIHRNKKNFINVTIAKNMTCINPCHIIFENFFVKKQTNIVHNHIGRLEKTEVSITMKDNIKRRISGEEKETVVSFRNPVHTDAVVAATASFQNKTVFKGKRIVTTMESQERP